MLMAPYKLSPYVFWLATAGVPRWQYAFTRVGLDPTAEQWFRFLCPERLSIDIKDNKRSRRSAASRKSPSTTDGITTSHSGSKSAKRGGKGGATRSGKPGNSQAGAACGKSGNLGEGTHKSYGSTRQARGRKGHKNTPRLSMEKIEKKAAQRKAATTDKEGGKHKK